MPYDSEYNTKMGGSTKSNKMNAPMEDTGGNMGKPVGDKGKKSPKGNRMTQVPSDRYNY